MPSPQKSDSSRSFNIHRELDVSERHAKLTETIDDEEHKVKRSIVVPSPKQKSPKERMPLSEKQSSAEKEAYRTFQEEAGQRRQSDSPRPDKQMLKRISRAEEKLAEEQERAAAAMRQSQREISMIADQDQDDDIDDDVFKEYTERLKQSLAPEIRPQEARITQRDLQREIERVQAQIRDEKELQQNMEALDDYYYNVGTELTHLRTKAIEKQTKDVKDLYEWFQDSKEFEEGRDFLEAEKQAELETVEKLIDSVNAKLPSHRKLNISGTKESRSRPSTPQAESDLLPRREPAKKVSRIPSLKPRTSQSDLESRIQDAQKENEMQNAQKAATAKMKPTEFKSKLQTPKIRVGSAISQLALPKAPSSGVGGSPPKHSPTRGRSAIPGRGSQVPINVASPVSGTPKSSRTPTQQATRSPTSPGATYKSPKPGPSGTQQILAPRDLRSSPERPADLVEIMPKKKVMKGLEVIEAKRKLKDEYVEAMQQAKDNIKNDDDLANYLAFLSEDYNAKLQAIVTQARRKFTSKKPKEESIEVEPIKFKPTMLRKISAATSRPQMSTLRQPSLPSSRLSLGSVSRTPSLAAIPENQERASRIPARKASQKYISTDATKLKSQAKEDYQTALSAIKDQPVTEQERAEAVAHLQNKFRQKLNLIDKLEDRKLAAKYKYLKDVDAAKRTIGEPDTLQQVLAGLKGKLLSDINKLNKAAGDDRRLEGIDDREIAVEVARRERQAKAAAEQKQARRKEASLAAFKTREAERAAAAKQAIAEAARASLSKAVLSARRKSLQSSLAKTPFRTPDPSAQRVADAKKLAASASRASLPRGVTPKRPPSVTPSRASLLPEEARRVEAAKRVALAKAAAASASRASLAKTPRQRAPVTPAVSKQSLPPEQAARSAAAQRVAAAKAAAASASRASLAKTPRRRAPVTPAVSRPSLPPEQAARSAAAQRVAAAKAAAASASRASLAKTPRRRPPATPAVSRPSLPPEQAARSAAAQRVAAAKAAAASASRASLAKTPRRRAPVTPAVSRPSLPPEQAARSAAAQRVAAAKAAAASASRASLAKTPRRRPPATPAVSRPSLPPEQAARSAAAQRVAAAKAAAASASRASLAKTPRRRAPVTPAVSRPSLPPEQAARSAAAQRVAAAKAAAASASRASLAKTPRARPKPPQNVPTPKTPAVRKASQKYVAGTGAVKLRAVAKQDYDRAVAAAQRDIQDEEELADHLQYLKDEYRAQVDFINKLEVEKLKEKAKYLADAREVKNTVQDPDARQEALASLEQNLVSRLHKLDEYAGQAPLEVGMISEQDIVAELANQERLDRIAEGVKQAKKKAAAQEAARAKKAKEQADAKEAAKSARRAASRASIAQATPAVSRASIARQRARTDPRVPPLARRLPPLPAKKPAKTASQKYIGTDLVKLRTKAKEEYKQDIQQAKDTANNEQELAECVKQAKDKYQSKLTSINNLEAAKLAAKSKYLADVKDAKDAAADPGQLEQRLGDLRQSLIATIRELDQMAGADVTAAPLISDLQIAQDVAARQKIARDRREREKAEAQALAEAEQMAARIARSRVSIVPARTPKRPTSRVVEAPSTVPQPKKSVLQMAKTPSMFKKIQPPKMVHKKKPLTPGLEKFLKESKPPTPIKPVAKKASEKYIAGTNTMELNARARQEYEAQKELAKQMIADEDELNERLRKLKKDYSTKLHFIKNMDNYKATAQRKYLEEVQAARKSIKDNDILKERLDVLKDELQNKQAYIEEAAGMPKRQIFKSPTAEVRQQIGDAIHRLTSPKTPRPRETPKGRSTGRKPTKDKTPAIVIHPASPKVDQQPPEAAKKLPMKKMILKRKRELPKLQEEQITKEKPRMPPKASKRYLPVAELNYYKGKAKVNYDQAVENAMRAIWDETELEKQLEFLKKKYHDQLTFIDGLPERRRKAEEKFKIERQQLLELYKNDPQSLNHHLQLIESEYKASLAQLKEEVEYHRKPGPSKFEELNKRLLEPPRLKHHTRQLEDVESRKALSRQTSKLLFPIEGRSGPLFRTPQPENQADLPAVPLRRSLPPTLGKPEKKAVRKKDTAPLIPTLQARKSTTPVKSLQKVRVTPKSVPGDRKLETRKLKGTNVKEAHQKTPAAAAKSWKVPPIARSAIKKKKKLEENLKKIEKTVDSNKELLEVVERSDKIKTPISKTSLKPLAVRMGLEPEKQVDRVLGRASKGSSALKKKMTSVPPTVADTVQQKDHSTISPLAAEEADGIFKMMMNEDEGVNLSGEPGEIVRLIVPSDGPTLPVTGNAVESLSKGVITDQVPVREINALSDRNAEEFASTVKQQPPHTFPVESIAAKRLPEEQIEVPPATESHPKDDYIQHDLLLHSFEVENFFQSRGSTFPKWFPGIYTVFPEESPKLVLKKSPSEVLHRAWQIMKPKFATKSP